MEGCNNKVQRKGLCIKHGARDDLIQCNFEGCRNASREGGICKKHLKETYDHVKLYEGGGEDGESIEEFVPEA